MTTVYEFYVPEKHRKNTRKILGEHFKKNISDIVEKGIYDYTRQYCESNSSNFSLVQGIYKDISQNIIFNLENNNDTIKNIKIQISKKKYNAYNIAFLNPYELDYDPWSKILLRKATTEDKLTNLPTIKWDACRQCKNKEYFYWQLQTRSADEPMTTFYRCKECDKTYKVNN